MSILVGTRGWLIACAAVAALAVAGYLGMPSDAPADRVRVGILPDQSREILEARYQPIMQRLSDTLGMPFELVIADDYEGLVQLFVAGDVDLAYFGGLTFLRAEEKAGARPLVMRSNDLNFHSYFLVRADETASSLGEMKGRKLAFGSNLSTSGHLMPRFFMERDGFQPEVWFSQVAFSGAHDKTAYWVRDGIADIGIANSAIVDRMFESGRLDPKSVRVLGKTPPYADYVWAAQPGMPDEISARIRDIFLSLSPAQPEDLAILTSLEAESFLPALTTDYAQLRIVAARLSLLD